MTLDRKKVMPVTQPMRVYICNWRGCKFEHWDGLELVQHLIQAHGYSERRALTRARRTKLQNSEIWRLSKHK